MNDPSLEKRISFEVVFFAILMPRNFCITVAICGKDYLNLSNCLNWIQGGIAHPGQPSVIHGGGLETSGCLIWT